MRMLLGCDFSSAPSVRKPVTVAVGEACAGVVALHRIEEFRTLDAWQAWLAQQPAWVGAFDFPFGLPRELVQAWGWPTDWSACMRQYAALDRAELRQRFRDFCAARPVGRKFAHRATDGPAGASPSMKWVHPPVAWMMHAGVPRLMALGACFPGLGGMRPSPHVALEGYPGLLAREFLGRRSYKADDPVRQSDARRQARAELLAWLCEEGSTRLGLRLALSAPECGRLMDEGSGDRLDAVLCLMQAAWAQARTDSPGVGYGLPRSIDALEGWIVSA